MSDRLPIYHMLVPCLPGVRDEATYCFGAFRLAWAESGRACWQIGAKVHVIEPGRMAALSAGEVRRIVDFLSPETLMLHVLEFGPEAVDYEMECLRLFYCRTEAYENCVPESVRTRELRQLLVGELARAESSSEMMVKSLLKALLIAATRDALSAAPDGLDGNASDYQKDAAVSAAALYIANHLAEPLSTPQLARKFCMSESGFARLFRRQMGMCSGEYIAWQRVNAVMRLLSTSDITVLDAAFRCGFTSSSGFYRTFHALTGASPLRLLGRRETKESV